jgi:uncharacterized protein involved in outer membrane biogenesis
VKKVLRILAIILLVVIVLAALAPTLLSTGPGRSLAESYLSSRVGGRKVTIGRLDVGHLSGVLLEDLTIAERPGFGDEPFVRVASIRFENPPLALLWSNETLKELTITKPEVSIVRRQDGELSIGDLVEKEKKKREEEEKKREHEPRGPTKRPAFTLPVAVTGAAVLMTDQKLGTSVALEGFHLTALYDRGRIEITEGEGRLNDGRLTVKGFMDQRERPEPFDLDVSLADCHLEGNLSRLGYLVPILYNPFGKTSTKIDFQATLSGRGTRKADLKANLTGTTRLVLRDLRVEGSETVQQLVSLVRGLLKLEHDALTFDSLTAESRIADGRITTDPARPIQAAHGRGFTMSMSGHTDFDGSISYRVSLEGSRVDEVLSGLNRLVDIKLYGTLKKPKVGLSSSGEGSVLDDILGLFNRKEKDKEKKQP